MRHGIGSGKGGVALLVDFENLVRGVERAGGELDCGLLTALAAGFGRVRVARAYADWRMADTGPHRERVAGAGIEAVDVLVRREGVLVKNAVDVRMAVDAVELAWSMPRVGIYVLATGDRDFVPVVQALRRHGRSVVGVCPRDAASGALADACEAFVDYEALAERAVAGPVDPAGRWTAAAKRALGRIAAPEWLHGVRCRATAPRRAGERDARAHAVRGARPTGGGAGGAGDGTGPAGLVWVRWVRERLGSGALAVNADGGWLHRIGDEAYVVVPDCFEACAAADGVAVKTVKNRVMRLGLHRVRVAGGAGVDLFRAALVDGRVVRGMLFPGELLWGGAVPAVGAARLTGRARGTGKRRRECGAHSGR